MKRSILAMAIIGCLSCTMAGFGSSSGFQVSVALAKNGCLSRTQMADLLSDWLASRFVTVSVHSVVKNIKILAVARERDPPVRRVGDAAPYQLFSVSEK